MLNFKYITKRHFGDLWFCGKIFYYRLDGSDDCYLRNQLASLSIFDMGIYFLIEEEL